MLAPMGFSFAAIVLLSSKIVHGIVRTSQHQAGLEVGRRVPRRDSSSPFFPTRPSKLQEFACASEDSATHVDCPECSRNSKCECTGYVKFGYDPLWTPWQPSSGIVNCSISTFADPYPGHGKLCMCSQDNVVGGSILSSASKYTGVWWPVVIVSGSAILVAAALAFVHCANFKSKQGPIGVALEATAPVVHSAPMICAVFLAVAVRAMVLQQSRLVFTALGQPDARATALVDRWGWASPKLPDQPRLHLLIQISSVLFVCKVVFRLVYERNEASEIETQNFDMHPAARKSFNSLRPFKSLYFATSTAMYMFISAIFVHLLMMGSIPFTAATKCTLILAAVYFACKFMLYVAAKSFEEDSFVVHIMMLACLNMDFAPMLGVLFLGMQQSVDVGVAPVPQYVQRWMTICTGSVLLQAFLSILMPVLFGCAIKDSSKRRLAYGEVRMQKAQGLLLFTSVRWIAMAILFLGLWEVCRAIWFVGAVPSRSHTLCALAGLYFAVYLALWGVMTMRQVFEDSYMDVLRAILVAKDAAALCPMVAALFLGCWIVSR